MERKDRPVRVLHVVTGIDVGGVSTLLLSYYGRMDRTRVKFDIVAIDIGREQFFAPAFRELGADVYYMPKPYRARLLYLWKLMGRVRYDVVHSHIELPSAVYLSLAMLRGVRHRVAHAHMAFHRYAGLHHKLLRRLLVAVSTVRMGCSRDALCWLFGKQAAAGGVVLHNAIDIARFSYRADVREACRKELGLEGKYVVGFVGRFTEQKNVFFMQEIFRAFRNRHPEAVLLTVGDGELKDEFFRKAAASGLDGSMVNLGPRQDVPALMMAMDALLLPSRWEGLGIVLIEAQAACLKCLAPRETVPYDDTDITPYIHYCGINDTAEAWAAMMERECVGYKRTNTDELLRSHHYDIDREAALLTDFYCGMNSKR